MKKLCFFASAACLALAVNSTASSQTKVEEVKPGPSHAASRSGSFVISITGLHVAVLVSKGSRFAYPSDGADASAARKEAADDAVAAVRAQQKK